MQPAAHQYRNEPQPHRRRDVASPAPADTGELRLAIGTRVRLHTYHSEAIEVGLTDILGVTSWNDVVAKVAQGQAIVIESLGAQQRIVFAGGVVLWAEALPREA